ncbi:MAG: glycoside hydrolase family 2 protein, partial [Bacteroidales bacterium]|nr:glycoside hydrolase family 2 protein [Bacteroidales bacterium]
MFFLLLIASIGCGKPKVVNLDLKALNWSLSSVSDSIAVDSAITDDVHLALIDKGVIPDPFFRDNEKHVQWVGQTAWVYETTFDLPSDLLTDKGLDLVFEGLDTYTRIVLNGHTIAETNNMFRSYRFPVEKWLIKKDNALSVTFFPPEVINDRKEALYGILLPEKRGFSRKAPYQFGWDWGPKLVTMGLWKPARIESRKALELVDVFVDQLFVSDSVVDLLVISSVRSEMKTSVELHVSVDGSEVKRVPVELSAGDTILSIPLRVYDLPLWYPIGLGKASRVKVQVEIVQDNIKESKSVDIGLRSIKLVDKEDAAGTGFVFVVNGHEVYVKGANYIPQDNFLSRVTREQTRDLLVMAQKSNMNMLRVWGGGAYETDDFYTLCDSLGLMVWQDFMFAGTVYPGDSAFLQNVTLEAEQQIIRLRNHPSIALWCGNNEVDEAWHNWGWQKSLGYSENDSSKLWNDYLLLFEDILPEKVKELDPQISYVPSSPA